jgi:1-phosphofructokinase family hexose kinase
MSGVPDGERCPRPILVVCPNAALEITFRVPSLQGKVIGATRMMWEPGGKGTNVARILRVRGIDVELVLCGGGHLGALIKERLGEEGIKYSFVDTMVETRASVVLVPPDPALTLIVRSDGFAVDPSLARVLQGKVAARLPHHGYVVLSGSLPTGFPQDFYYGLCAMAEAKGQQVVVDCAGVALVEALRARPFLVKPNRQEAEEILECELSSLSARLEALEQFRRMGGRNIILSLGAEGAVALLGDRAYVARKHADIAINPAGAGDALLAGVLEALNTGRSWPEALREGVTLAAMSTTLATSGRVPESTLVEGRENLVSVEEVA